MQNEKSKLCGNCVFLEYTNTQKRHADKHKVDINRTSWGFCRKNGQNFYKTQTCEKHEFTN